MDRRQSFGSGLFGTSAMDIHGKKELHISGHNVVRYENEFCVRP